MKKPANCVVELAYLLLSHLALFPMPVEPRVLYGCNEVRDVLARICDPDGAPATSNAERARLRLRRLRLLNQVLDYMRTAHLVIAVRSKPHSEPLMTTCLPSTLGRNDRARRMACCVTAFPSAQFPG